MKFKHFHIHLKVNSDGGKKSLDRFCFCFSLGTSSVCADVCTSVEPHVELDLSNAHTYRKHEQVRIDLHPTGSGRCREPGTMEHLLRSKGIIVK